MKNEEVATVSTQSIPTPDTYQTAKKKRDYEMFDVPPEVFRRFQCGRNRFERWSKYLDCTDESQKKIYDFAKTNRRTMIVLRDSSTGALRGIRRRAHNES